MNKVISCFLIICLISCKNNNENAADCESGLPCLENDDCGPEYICEQNQCIAPCSVGCCGDDYFCKVENGVGICMDKNFEKLGCPSDLKSCWPEK